jgi:glutamyl-tRNA synthetase
MRIEDLDGPRCREEFVAAALDDLHWLGIEWTEGPGTGGPHAPYRQRERTASYLDVWRRLEATGTIYPSPHSRKDVEEAGSAPHAAARPRAATPDVLQEDRRQTSAAAGEDRLPPDLFPPSLRPTSWPRASAPGGVPWRFRVPDGRTIEFADALCGTVRRTAGIDFGDFIVWRRDDLAAYELAVVADDHAMEIDEVVRGADLLTSTARQLLLYEALGWTPPAWCHAPLVCDAAGNRLAKRAGGLAIRDFRDRGLTPDDVLRQA